MSDDRVISDQRKVTRKSKPLPRILKNTDKNEVIGEVVFAVYHVVRLPEKVKVSDLYNDWLDFVDEYEVESELTFVSPGDCMVTPVEDGKNG